ncbi:uncharacterized protein Z520_02582 [Fonsecaea multimorphosa CBS 102226]|uniref:Uncharacterized protein n=1 Tax=Fonsecaea multimorphosa CBS 102226 TaxID=1442371 RepID=A0A0D2K8R6_9EURO|nr:uncharacterized protein Z520_02582 [Fonsecaea multimorphosa CBS 102226]KIY02443.1 hypothetical protein Z520_02582 [Fonsecaea multimorphosa CBS 102226]
MPRYSTHGDKPRRKLSKHKYSKINSPPPSITSEAPLLPKPLWTWKDSIKYYVARAKGEVKYAIDMYRINKVLGEEFDY